MHPLSWLGPRFDVDFAARRPPVPPLAWMLLAAGALSIAFAMGDLSPRWSRHERLLAQRAELQRSVEGLPGSRAASHPASPIEQGEARAMLAELNRPWTELFDRFEAVDVPKVYLVQLGVDSRFQTVQMLAEGSRLDDVLQYSQKLAGDGPLRAVRLTHHEWRTAPVGRVIVANLTGELSGRRAASAGELR